MSSQLKYIFKQEELPIAQNLEALNEAAIDIAKRLSSDIWSDYNDHDPGVTIIEQFCYAIMEMSYKANFDFEQLFFANRDKELKLREYFLLEPKEVFYTNPVTPLDYRRKLLDYSDEFTKKEGVNKIIPTSFVEKSMKNIWFVPSERAAYSIYAYIDTGKIDEQIQKEVEAKTQPEQAKELKLTWEKIPQLKKDVEKKVEDEIRQRIYEIYHKYRNIGEKCENVYLLKPVSLHTYFSLNKEEEIQLSAKKKKESLKIFIQKIKEFIELPVSYKKRIADFDFVDTSQKKELFQGPIPSKSFINPTSLRTSSKINVEKPIDIASFVARNSQEWNEVIKLNSNSKDWENLMQHLMQYLIRFHLAEWKDLIKELMKFYLNKRNNLINFHSKEWKGLINFYLKEWDNLTKFHSEEWDNSIQELIQHPEKWDNLIQKYSDNRDDLNEFPPEKKWTDLLQRLLKHLIDYLQFYSKDWDDLIKNLINFYSKNWNASIDLKSNNKKLQRVNFDNLIKQILIFDEKVFLDTLKNQTLKEDIESNLKENKAKSSAIGTIEWATYAPNSTISQTEIEDYYSIQYTFPSNYNLGQMVVSGMEESKKQQIQNLQAYLLLFESLLVDFLVKLVVFPELLKINISTNEIKEDSTPKNNKHGHDNNFDNLNDSFLNIIAQIPGVGHSLKAKDQLKEFYGKHCFPIGQKIKLREYALARYGETFDTDLIKRAWGEPEDFEKDWLKRLSELMQNYTTYSQNQHRSFDILDKQADFPLSQKLSILLNENYDKNNPTVYIIEEQLVPSRDNARQVYRIVIVIDMESIKKMTDNTKKAIKTLIQRELPLYLNIMRFYFLNEENEPNEENEMNEENESNEVNLDSLFEIAAEINQATEQGAIDLLNRDSFKSAYRIWREALAERENRKY